MLLPAYSCLCMLLVVLQHEVKVLIEIHAPKTLFFMIKTPKIHKGTGWGCAQRRTTEVPVQAREIGFVFQSYALFRHMTVAQNIAFGPRIGRLGIDVDDRRVSPSDTLDPCVSGTSWSCHVEVSCAYQAVC